MPLAQIFSLISLATLIFLCLVLILDRRKQPGFSFLIGILLLMILVNTLRVCYHFSSSLLLILPFLVFPATMVLGPLVYFYTRKVLFQHTIRGAEWLWFLILPVLSIAAQSFVHWSFPEARDVSGILEQRGALSLYTRLVLFTALLSSLSFAMAAGWMLRRYLLSIREEFAGAEAEQVSWLKLLLSLCIFFSAVYLAVLIVSVFIDRKIPVTPFEAAALMLTAYLILYYYVRKPQIIAIPEENTGKEKYARQSLSPEERAQYLQRIEEFMEKEKPHLDKAVTLPELSGSLGIPPHHFSMVINIEKKMNFFQFVNRYRVTEAQQLMKDENYADSTLLEIGYMAGFQSKAGFNKGFKELTGLTPSQYRASLGVKKTA